MRQRNFALLSPHQVELEGNLAQGNRKAGLLGAPPLGSVSPGLFHGETGRIHLTNTTSK